jgi:hypothetical protein
MGGWKGPRKDDSPWSHQIHTPRRSHGYHSSSIMASDAKCFLKWGPEWGQRATEVPFRYLGEWRRCAAPLVDHARIYERGMLTANSDAGACPPGCQGGSPVVQLILMPLRCTTNREGPREPSRCQAGGHPVAAMRRAPRAEVRARQPRWPAQQCSAVHHTHTRTFSLGFPLAPSRLVFMSLSTSTMFAAPEPWVPPQLLRIGRPRPDMHATRARAYTHTHTHAHIHAHTYAHRL